MPFFATAGDTVAFGGFDSWIFGAVPTNGTDSLDRLTGVGPNSPTNYTGATGSVNANPPPGVPASSPIAIAVMTSMLVLAGAVALQSRRARVL